MVTSLWAGFGIGDYDSYGALESHEFIRSRCCHHRKVIIGDAWIGEQTTIIHTHTEQHEIRLYESWDGCSFQITRETGLCPGMQLAAISALIRCGVQQIEVKIGPYWYEVADLGKLGIILSGSYTYLQLYLWILQEDRHVKAASKARRVFLQAA